MHVLEALRCDPEEQRIKKDGQEPLVAVMRAEESEVAVDGEDRGDESREHNERKRDVEEGPAHPQSAADCGEAEDDEQGDDDDSSCHELGQEIGIGGRGRHDQRKGAGRRNQYPGSPPFGRGGALRP